MKIHYKNPWPDIENVSKYVRYFANLTCMTPTPTHARAAHLQSIQERNNAHDVDTLLETVMSTLGRWRIRCVSYICGVFGRRGRRGDFLDHYRHSSSTPTHWGYRPVIVRSKLHRKEKFQKHVVVREASNAVPKAVDARSQGLNPVQSPMSSGKPPQLSRSNSTVLNQAENGVHVLGSGGGGGGGGGYPEGLTRGQRLQVSYRHYDIHTAAEVLRRSPLPEKAVWRKMRQIVGTRLGPAMSSLDREGSAMGSAGSGSYYRSSSSFGRRSSMGSRRGSYSSSSDRVGGGSAKQSDSAIRLSRRGKVTWINCRFDWSWSHF